MITFIHFEILHLLATENFEAVFDAALPPYLLTQARISSLIRQNNKYCDMRSVIRRVHVCMSVKTSTEREIYPKQEP